jgi:hypothetical protein
MLCASCWSERTRGVKLQAERLAVQVRTGFHVENIFRVGVNAVSGYVRGLTGNEIDQTRFHTAAARVQEDETSFEYHFSYSAG